jgi:hypothetical protein
MRDEQLDIAYFIAFCVEQYKNLHGMSGKEVMSLFDTYGVASHLEQHYDVLHTQGHHWLLAEIDDFIADRKKREVKK